MLPLPASLGGGRIHVDQDQIVHQEILYKEDVLDSQLRRAKFK
jgi:hypothetical protein